MTRPKEVSDMALHLENTAQALEKEAHRLRRLARMSRDAYTMPLKLSPSTSPEFRALHKAALELIDRPAQEIRTAARAAAKKHKIPVEPVKIVAQRLRAERKDAERRKRDLKIVRTYASGLSYDKTAEKCAVSRRTAINVVQAAIKSGVYDGKRGKKNLPF